MSTEAPPQDLVEAEAAAVKDSTEGTAAPTYDDRAGTASPAVADEKNGDNDNANASNRQPAASATTSPSAASEADTTTMESPMHKASSNRTAEALQAFKRKMGLCEVEGCEHKSDTTILDTGLCQHHFENGMDAPPLPARRGRKRKSDIDDDDANMKTRSAGSPDPSSDLSSGVPKNTCMVDGCEKLRARGGFCTRHFKDRSAPIRSGPAEYERRYCMKEGCDKLRSKGYYCHRHNLNIDAPVKAKGSAFVASTDRKKLCIIAGCDRLQVKGGHCSRHSKNPDAPVKETPAFSFDADTRWDELFPQLEAYAKEHGHARYPTSKKSDMAKFVTQIRSVYRQKKNKSMKGNPNADPNTVEPDLSSSKLLTPERMEALKDIGFEFQLWTVEPGQWEQRFQGKTTCVCICVD